jgi:hypothetical protein
MSLCKEYGGRKKAVMQILVARVRLSYCRLKRLLFGFPIATLLVVFGAFISVYLSTKQVSNWLFFILGLVGLTTIAVQACYNYRKSKFDVTLALKYDDKFFVRSKPERLLAATAAKLVLNAKDDESYHRAAKNTDIEPVLDIFEDIGFLVHGDQISDEVVHHFFYHWIRMYVSPLEKYIIGLRSKEEAEYKYILPLFYRIRLIEAREKGRGFFGQLNFNVVLDEEEKAELRDDLAGTIQLGG